MSGPIPGSDPNYPQGQPQWNAPQQPGYQPAGYGPAPTYAGPAAGPSSMSMPDAVRSVLTQYAGFSGRARRSEYWYFFLANFLASVVASIIDAALGVSLLQWIVTLALLLPGLAVSVRRMHDTGRSGWWLLLGLIPLVGAIILIVVACQDSRPQANRWGPSPKYQAVGGYVGA
jgi:uncharacterized membrane protein YhaH (DUF805 family)